jgi:hypothetical protein
MATVVRIEGPPEAPLGDFSAVMQAWLDHHCIMPAYFRSVSLPNKSGVFDVGFDSPQDAFVFGRRFGGQPVKNLPLCVASRRSISDAIYSSVDRGPYSIRAAIAADLRRIFRGH